MLFTTVHFLLFFSVVFLLYWITPSQKNQLRNLILLFAGYFFYACFNWHFLFLLIAYTIGFYVLGKLIDRSVKESVKKYALWGGVFAGVGMLVYFKYMNFFISSIDTFLSGIHLSTSLHTLQIIAPIGISFYTFRLLSYLIDIYQEEYKPEEDLIDFACYVSFFPCIISGPIDRPGKLIPQLQHSKKFDYNQASDGCRQIIWGLFKKLVIADNCVWFVNNVFDRTELFTGSTLLLGAFFALIQIYADFSGYSDMAIGLGKLLGFELTINFHYPLFATSIADFWRRWHISLTSWLTDYVFTPLSFIWRRKGKYGIIAAILINFFIVGIWHGANWTYIVYGLLNGILFIPFVLKGTMYKSVSGMKLFYRIGTCLIMSFLIIFFRAETLHSAIAYINSIFTKSFFTIPQYENKTLCAFILMMFVVEWLNRDKEHGLDLSRIQSKYVRFILYFLLLMICYFFKGEAAEFIYIQY